jgi:hypothetical protein
VVRVTDPYGRNFFFQVAPPRENLLVPGIEPRSLDLLPGTLTTRPQSRSCSYNGIFNWFFVYFTMLSQLRKLFGVEYENIYVMSIRKVEERSDRGLF